MKSIFTKKNDHYRLPHKYADHRFQQKKFHSSAGDIAYLDYGKGPVLLLIHGVPTSSWLYRLMIPQLQKRYRVIAVDLLGYGSSDKPKSIHKNYSPLSQAKYIQQLMRHLKVPHYNILFHDMGGLVSWELLNLDINKEEKIKNFIALNTIISEKGFNHPTLKKGFSARFMSELFSNTISAPKVLKMTFDEMGLSLHKILSDDECYGYVRPMEEGSDQAIYSFFTGFDSAQFSRLDKLVKNMKNFKGNAMVLWGKQDTTLTTKQLASLEKSIDISPKNIHIYKNNAHFLQEEIPLELNRQIIRFLNEN